MQSELLKKIEDKLAKLANGNFLEEEEEEEEEEVGFLFRDINKTLNNLIQDSNLIYDAIVEHEYHKRIDETKYRGNFSIFASRLNATIENYQNERWITDSIKTIHDLVTSEKDPKKRIEIVFLNICRKLNIQAGVLYLYDKKILKLYSKYGHLHSTDEIKSEYTLGEDVIGQVANSREHYIFEMPKNLSFKTALTTFSPRAVYVYPLVYQNDLYGVIELATIKRLSETQKKFLSYILDILSATIYTNILTIKNLKNADSLKKILDSQTNFTLLTNGKELRLANRSFLEFFGYESLEDFKRDHNCICDFFEEEEEEEEEEEFLHKFHNDENWLEYILENREKSYKTKIKDKSGNTHIFQVVVSGKKIEEEEEEEEEELYVIIFNDVTELYEAIKDEKRAREAKEIFLANMSHDIRTPLNGIISTLAILQKSELNKKQQHLVNICKNSTSLLVSIVNDVLDLSKLQTGKFQLNPRNSDLEKVLVELGEIYEFQAKSKDLNFRLYIDEKLPECIVCDPDRLKQIFINLLSNALKFTKEGEVIFEIRVLNKAQDKIRLRFAIIDTGIGIAKDRQKEIFDPFKQEDQTTATKFGGTGLGLSIVKELVELHSSKLELESNEGLGSEFAFEVDFALCGKSLEEEEEEEEEEEVDFSNAHILIAEDNETNQMVIEMLLEDFGIEDITITKDGLECVQEYIKRHKEFDLIFMDINMPNMDGVEATKKILEFEKLDGGLGHTPIVALTANSMAGDREKYLKNGFDEYLSKPIEEYKLLKILKNFLRKG